MAIQITKIIGPDFLKEYVKKINSNVDNDLIELSIIESQDINLQPILGSNLYNKILDDVDGDVLTGVYLTLVDDFCLKVIIYNTLRRITTELLIKYDNKSISEYDGDNSKPVSLELLKFKLSQINNDTQFYEERLRNHLLEEGNNLYTEYDTESGLDEMKVNKNTAYFSGMDVTSRSRFSCRNKYIRY